MWYGFLCLFAFPHLRFRRLPVQLQGPRPPSRRFATLLSLRLRVSADTRVSSTSCTLRERDSAGVAVGTGESADTPVTAKAKNHQSPDLLP